MKELSGFTLLRSILQPGVYALVYKGEIVYIGKSRAVIIRAAEHLRKSRIVFDSIYFKLCENIEEEETRLITKFKPRYNIAKTKRPFIIVNSKRRYISRSSTRLEIET